MPSWGPPSPCGLRRGSSCGGATGEGVFAVVDGKAEFTPIKMGIAGDKFFEVLTGIKSGDQVITGPYNSVRGMADGDLVKVENGKKK